MAAKLLQRGVPLSRARWLTSAGSAEAPVPRVDVQDRNPEPFAGLAGPVGVEGVLHGVRFGDDDDLAGLDPRTPPGLNVSDLPFRAADLAGNTAAAIPEPSKPAQFLQMPAAGLAGM